MLVLSFFAFLSGIVTILSPCILPVLPLILSGSVGGKRKPLGVVVGFVLSFSVFTLVLSTLVQALNISAQSLRGGAILIIILFGLVLLIPGLQMKFELLTSKLTSRNQTANTGRTREGFGGGIVAGASLGLLWTPCVGPIMASVISLAISQQVDGGAAVIVLFYSLGTAIPLFGIMIGGRRLINRFPLLSRNTGRIQRIFGIILIVLGVSLYFGMDRKFQTLVLDTFPSWGSGITAVEENGFIERALEERTD